jgi:CxxC motif-containing protein
LRKAAKKLSREVRKVMVNCIICPQGCRIETVGKGTKVLDISGYDCERGRNYAVEEVTAPKRVLTTTVRVVGGQIKLLPVKTAKAIPKELIFPCMNVLGKIIVEAPIDAGEVVREDLVHTKVNVIATRSIKKRPQSKDTQ